MARPLCEVADVIRMVGSKLWNDLGKPLTWGQVKVLQAIVSCRTAALGGHRDRCTSCGYEDCHLPLVPQSPLPEVSGQCSREVAPQPATRVAARRVFSYCFSIPHRLVPLIGKTRNSCFRFFSKTPRHSHGSSFRP